MKKVTEFCVSRPRTVTAIMVGITLILALLAALPSMWPDAFKMLNPVQVDTDPENMLPHDEPVRVFHEEMKKEFALYEMIVLGVVNEKHPDGVFNPQSLQKIYELTEFAKTLRWPDEDNPGQTSGVIEVEMIAPSTVDNIEQAGPGTIRFEWLMPEPPQTREEALAVAKKARRIPFLYGTVLSENEKALALYLPLTSKDVSYKIASQLKEKIAEFDESDDQYYITGLPVAEDTFGVDMFKQMALSAPMAMLIIFLLMLFFFRKLSLIISPLIVALVSVICTMGLLVATGNTIHIMSSMIPIFIMPIAVLDAVHILSEFFDRYQETKDRRKTIMTVMKTLFTPMLYTSLTTAVGFGSLALAPIPPVQTFGIFVAIGVMMAWVWTITFVPAFVMFIPQKKLENFGLMPHDDEGSNKTMMTRLLGVLGKSTYKYARVVLVAVAVLVIVAVYGITRININDNPVKWFKKSHPIRIADRALNKHFGGTYMAYLALEPEQSIETPDQAVASMKSRAKAKAESLSAEMVEHAGEVFGALTAEAEIIAATVDSKKELLAKLEEYADGRSFDVPDEEYDAWNEALLFVSSERNLDEVFKNPDLLEYIADFQKYLKTIKNEDGVALVGKSNSVADIVKTVYRELTGGSDENFRIPDSSNAVAQSLMQYQNSHRPQDLWHFVTPDYRKTSLWLQLKSGDNMNMVKLVEFVDDYMAKNPAPIKLVHKWFGPTYINVTWQEKMVSGMLNAFLGSFLIVLLMMIVLFRSGLWGILSMVPLTITIGLIYGMIGLIGKDYDMPVAVLSSLSLGLAVDYAIHFLARSRELHKTGGTWNNTIGAVFGEPARAITRNILVIGVGFLPLLAAPLLPYRTVGIFIASILLTAGVATLFILPALIKLLERWLFPKTDRAAFTCKCGTCILSSVVGVILIVLNGYRFLKVGISTLSIISAVAIVVLMLVCQIVAKRESCKSEINQGEQK
jgi:uncharacterized protein